MEYSKTWLDFYDSYGIKDDGKSGRGFEYYDNVKIWNVYMTELVGGSINEPIKLVTEGAKICVPIILVVPPGNDNEKTFASMLHFGSYEPYNKLQRETKLEIKIEEDLYWESLDNIMNLFKIMIENGISLAKLRGIKANVYITLGCEIGNPIFISNFLEIMVNKEDINIIYHDSFKTCCYEYGHNSIVNAIVFPCGSVQLNISRYNYRVIEGRLLYHKHSINNILDGTFNRNFYVIANNNYLCIPFKLHPQDQEFLILDMDIENEETINYKRICFVQNLLNRILLFNRSSLIVLNKVKII